MRNGRQLLPPLTDWDRFCFLTFLLIVTVAVISLFRRRRPIDDSAPPAMPPIAVVDARSSIPDLADLRNPRTQGQSFNFSSNSYCSMGSGAGNPPRANPSRKPRYGKLRRPEAGAGGNDGAGVSGEVRDRLRDWNPYRSDESSGAGVGWNDFKAARSSARTAPNDVFVGLEKLLPDEMRKLDIGNGLNSDPLSENGVGGNFVPTKAGYNQGFVFGSSNFAATGHIKAAEQYLPDELRRMNIGAGVSEDVPISSTVGSGVFVFGAKRFNDTASSSSVLSDTTDMFLRDKVRNLNLGSDVASDTVFNGSKGEGSSPKLPGGIGRFFFGAKQQGEASDVSSVEAASNEGNFLFDGMRKLNINGNLDLSSNLNDDKLSQSTQEQGSGGADFIFVAKKQYDSNGRMNIGTNVPEEFGEKSLHGRSKSRNPETSSHATDSKSHISVGANVERSSNNGVFVFESKGRKEKFARESVIKESLDKHLSDEMKKLNMENSFNHSVAMNSNSTWQGVGHRTVTPRTFSGDSREFSHGDKVPKEMPTSKNSGSTNSSARVEKSFSSRVYKEKADDDLHCEFVIDPAFAPESILESKRPSEGEPFVFSGSSSRSEPFNVPADKQHISMPTPFIFQAGKLGVHKWPCVSGEDSSGKIETIWRPPSLNLSDSGVARNTCAVTSSDKVYIGPSPIGTSMKVEPSISMPNQDLNYNQSFSEESLRSLKEGFENDGYSKFTFCSARDSGLNDTTRKKRGKSKVKSSAARSKSSSREERSCSPMDFSPYQETLVDYQSTNETSRESADSNHHSLHGYDVNKIERGMKDKDNNADIATIAGTGSCVEESSKPVNQPLVNDYLNLHNNGFGDTGSEQTRSTSEMQANIHVTSPLESSPRTGFKFSSSPSQCALPSARHKYRRKFRTKGGYESFDVSSSSGLSCPQVSPVDHFLPLSKNDREDGPVSCDRRLAGNASHKSDFKVSVTHHEPLSATSTCVAAQKTCESWRLRGNQAYSNGNFLEAEEYYTHGVNCLSPNETHESCLQSLMKCYSNRALIRMSCGRIKEALDDCLMASSIDQNFTKVQIRAAKCYLDLGLIDDATKYFNNCLRSELDLNGTLFAEASDGLLKAEHASGYINRSAELLRSNTDDMSKALELITKGLSICPRSEHLLKMKAEALLKAQKYDEVVQLCERSLESALKNHGYYQIVNGVDIFMDAHVKFWRWNLMAKSYFHLGRLEKALDMCQMVDKGENNEEKHASSFSASSASFAVTVRELLSHKAAGNKAFQAGKHLDAVEHYTAALACNVESRPFAAICFCNRAAAYQSLGQIPDAIADCSLAIALDPHYAKAISRRATLHEMIRDYGHASADLQRLLTCLEEKAKENSVQHQKPMNPVNDDLKQARTRLALIEAEARKDTPLNFYMILGIDQSSSSAEIKKAYRKAALRHHPDKAAGQFLARLENCDERLWKEVSHEIIGDADRLFKMIGEANAVLSDPIKRMQYDEEEEIRSGSRRGDVYSGHRDSFERNSSQRHWQHGWRSNDNPRHRWNESKHSRYF